MSKAIHNGFDFVLIRTATGLAFFTIVPYTQLTRTSSCSHLASCHLQTVLIALSLIFVSTCCDWPLQLLSTSAITTLNSPG